MSHNKRGLAGWFGIFHPRYRSLLILLFCIANLASILAYSQNYLLTALTNFLVETGSVPVEGNPFVSFFNTLSAELKLSLPVLLLVLFVTANSASLLLEYAKRRLNGSLYIRTRNDIEAEVLDCLLGRDEVFFSHHSAAETVNRLTVDLNRIAYLRSSLARGWWAFVVVVANLIFFFQRQWLLALAICGTCIATAFWAKRMTRNIKRTDRLYLYQDDAVKTKLEDFLVAAPEIQVGRFYRKVRNQFGHAQRARARSFLQFTKMDALLGAGDQLGGLVAFVGAIGAIIYLRNTGGGPAVLSLLPVVIWVLPSVFRMSSDLVLIYLTFQMARTSMDRLMEYEAPPHSKKRTVFGAAPLSGAGAQADAGKAGATGRPADARASAITLEKVHFQYPGRVGGANQGGVAALSAAFAPNKWTAITGAAGAGKSTLLKLVLGLLRPQAGHLFYDGIEIDPAADARYASVLSYLPQTLALLSTSIRDNILFGRNGSPPAERQISSVDMEIIETLGLAHICRLKALDMFPDDSEASRRIAAHLSAIRNKSLHLSERPLPNRSGHPGGFSPLNPIRDDVTWRQNFVGPQAGGGRGAMAGDQDVLQMIETAGLNEAFTLLGLAFHIGLRGRNLSGGQGQLVALCRAVLRHTPVLILDEPTSSLDRLNSARMAHFLNAWKAGRVIITVSHDPAFVRNADEIYVMEQGRITYRGSFGELTQNAEVFRNVLWQDDADTVSGDEA